MNSNSHVTSSFAGLYLVRVGGVLKVLLDSLKEDSFEEDGNQEERNHERLAPQNDSTEHLSTAQRIDLTTVIHTALDVSEITHSVSSGT